MRTDDAPTIRLADYRAPDYLIETVDLDVLLHPTATRVKSLLRISPNPAGRPGAPLVLDGDELVCVSARLDDAALDVGAIATPSSFTLTDPPRRPFSLEIETRLNPSGNTKLMGLYRSNGVYCTQCEAEGFRRITYFLDRPDVLSIYTTRIEASKTDCPVLLGNGDPIAQGPAALVSRHFSAWHDPHPKPCYLFALVGGDLGAVRDRFVTASGREVALGIYVERGKEGTAGYAMDALKRAMAWDERVFGREYDLDVFNIVAVSDFNMGAMENKGLNIFNDKYILASPESATDADYEAIEAIVAHEYFHNWTGNRVTCRDWFQLCLKEGLTVFRDQEFSSDERSRSVQRIGDVKTLRSAQFPEDAGPLAHPVRPNAYQEINNFYTPTVYEKGAEVIRMLKALIGDEAFARGMELYFDRCDGTAATVEQFIACFAESSGRDLSAFMRWYEQAGTPILTVTSAYDASKGALQVTLRQRTAPTPGQADKRPVMLPIRLGLVGADGDLPLVSTDLAPEELARGVVILDSAERSVRFEALAERPALSLLRGFSAPVRLESDLSDQDLLRLTSQDSDAFNRWDAAQTLALRRLIAGAQAIRSGASFVETHDLALAFEALLDQAAAGRLDAASTAQILTTPSENDVAREIGGNVDPGAVRASREALRANLGRHLRERLVELRRRLARSGAFSPDAADAGRRALRNLALDYLAAGAPEIAQVEASAQLADADNMTEELAATATLATLGGETSERALRRFFARHEANPLLVDKWLSLQASLSDDDAPARIELLSRSTAFSWSNPNRVRALFAAFAANAPSQFHRPDGAGYRLLTAAAARVDAANPQLSARLLTGFKSWRIMEPGRRNQARAALEALRATADLSPDAKDILNRSLA
jgi:aminopeptidase N